MINTKTLVGGVICVVLRVYTLKLRYSQPEKNYKSFDTWESADRISTITILINSSTE
jgi:hypothetical protein